MLFNSPEFILLFMPVLLGICLMGRSILGQRGVVWVMIIASLIFYGWWDWRYVYLILGSIAINYVAGVRIQELVQTDQKRAKLVLVSSIVANIAVLGYYKYSNFLIDILAAVTPLQLAKTEIELPLAISFFTFTQIAFLVHCYRQLVVGLNPPSYSLFVLFFPHLIAGPIVLHRELAPQLDRPEFCRFQSETFISGLVVFLLGLFKKVCIADAFALYANPGFDQAETLTFFEAWATALSYTFQLYFDFSGYCDMAIGLARMFNVELPVNFDAPYKALSIQDFWKRWHITLGAFLRDYVYVPLGGNRNGRLLTLRNLFLTFLIGGIWHGAGWTFIIWGAMHGTALCIHRLWAEFGTPLPRSVAWATTFLFVVVAWVFFRAPDIESALMILRGMAGLQGIALPAQVLALAPALGGLVESVARLPFLADGSMMGIAELLAMMIIAAAIVAFGQPLERVRMRQALAWLALVALPFVMHQVFFSAAPSPFLYFRF